LPLDVILVDDRERSHPVVAVTRPAVGEALWQVQLEVVGDVV
jgi:hypothetical protein